jgi:hypothetical protein
MHWLKRDRWKAGTALAGMLLLLGFMVWVPVSAADAQERVSGLVTPTTGLVQATPTVDPTMTALEKEKLAQEIDQLKYQNYWAWTTIGPILVGFAGLLAALYSFFTWIRNRQDEQKKQREDRNLEREKRDEEQQRWLEDRKAERERRDEEQQRWLKDQEAEREKRAEERFQSAVTGLGDESEGAMIGAAILLRTFLRPGYEQFYTQTYDLTVANLCPSRTPNPPEDSETPLPLTTLRQALIVAFKEAFPLARSQNKGSPQSLDASYIQLDNAYLVGADLKQAWMPEAFLREAKLWMADLRGANLIKADLREANLWMADLSMTYPSMTHPSMTHLSKADLRGANLREAKLRGAHLGEANLRGADLREAKLGAYLGEANLRGADLSGADLSGADLRGADLREAKLSGAYLEDALSLKDTDLREVKGLTKEQLEACKAKGAIIDEDLTTSSSQSNIPTPPPSENTDSNNASLLRPDKEP